MVGQVPAGPRVTTVSRTMRALGAAAGVLVVFLWVLPMLLRDIRLSVAWWGMLSLLVLPVLAWRGRAFWRWCLGFAVIAAALALGPLGFQVQRGPIGVRILPAQYGIACSPGFACYGCIVPSIPERYAVVVSF
jgi:hypothetical protein